MIRRALPATMTGLAICLQIATPSKGDACPPPPLPCGKKWILPPESVVRLSQNFDEELDEVVVGDRSIVQTNGYTLQLKISRKFVINGVLTIRAFDPVPVVSVSPKPHRAADGRDYLPAEHNCIEQADATGSCLPLPGHSGTSGQDGEIGRTGTRGRDAGPIAVAIGGKVVASGTLIIDDRGEHGGDGGDGGDGGKGLDGTPGGDAVEWGDTGSCRQEAAAGGDGGHGGDGGKGGDGGPGGDGGAVVLLGIPPEVHIVFVECEGEGGAGGHPGSGGHEGRGLPGGLPAKNCASKRTDGKAGRPGAPRTDADAGKMSGSTGKSGKEPKLINMEHLSVEERKC